MSEFELLRRTSHGSWMLMIWAGLLALAAIGALWFAPAITRADPTALLVMSGRSQVVNAILAVVVLGLCLLIAGWRALAGLGGMLFGLGLLIFVLGPIVAAGASPALASWVGSVLMAFVTMHLTYGRSALAVAGIVGMAATLAVVCLVAWAAVSLALPGEPVVVAAAALSAFGGLCDVAITQVSSVGVGAQRLAGHPDRAQRQRTIRRDAMQVGKDHLLSMIHMLGFATFSGPALAISGLEGGLDGLVTVALVGCIAMAIGTVVITRIACMTIGCLPDSVLARLRLDEHGDDQTEGAGEQTSAPAERRRCPMRRPLLDHETIGPALLAALDEIGVSLTTDQDAVNRAYHAIVGGQAGPPTTAHVAALGWRELELLGELAGSSDAQSRLPEAAALVLASLPAHDQAAGAAWLALGGDPDATLHLIRDPAYEVRVTRLGHYLPDRRLAAHGDLLRATHLLGDPLVARYPHEDGAWWSTYGRPRDGQICVVQIVTQGRLRTTDAHVVHRGYEHPLRADHAAVDIVVRLAALERSTLRA